MKGNARFLRGEPRFATASKEDLADLVKGQHPFATILGCSDSRVPPELIFDAKFGDLFVVRVRATWCRLRSGAACNTRALTSTRNFSWCSDTKAAVQCRRRLRPNSTASRNFRASSCCSRACFQALTRSTRSFRRNKGSNAPVESNVRWSIRQFFDTPEGRARMAEGRIKVVGAVYEIATGRVRLLRRSVKS